MKPSLRFNRFYGYMALVKTTSIVLLSVWGQMLHAQTKSYTGTIVDAETRKPIVGALLLAENALFMSGMTSHEGSYTIEAQTNSAHFTVSKSGYTSRTVLLHVDSPATVLLQPLQHQMDEVTVVYKKPLEKGIESLPQIAIDKERISRNSSAGLGEMIAQVDGVSFISTGTNIQLPVIHGLYGNRILVLNNGFRHGFQNWGRDHAPEIDVSGADRIVVIKGAAGVKYGPDALGGAVIIENNPMDFNTGFYGRATTSYQTNGRGYGVNAIVGEGRENFSYHIGANVNQVGDRRAPNYNLTNTGAREYAIQAGMRYRLNAWDVKANYSVVNQNFGILRAAIGNSGPALIRNMEAEIPTFIRPFSYEINEPNQLVNHQMASASLSRALNRGRLSLRYARQWNARREFDVRRNADLPVLDLELETDDLQLEWEHKWSDRLSGSWGIQYVSQSNSNNPGTLVTPFIPNYTSSRISAYVMETLKVNNDRWEVGVRYDYESNAVGGRDSRQAVFRDNFTFSNVTAAIGHIKSLNSHTTLRNNLGTGWRPPNMAELYSFGQHESQTTFGLLRYEAADNGGIRASRVIPLNESEVLPENSVKYTSELDWQKNKQRISITGYANYIRNFIFSRPIGVLGTARGPMPTFIIDQSDALFLGVDATYSLMYHKNGKALIGGSYIWTKNVQRDETLINQPPIHLHLQVNHTFYNFSVFDKVVVSLTPTYTFTQFQAPRYISVRNLVEGTETIDIDDPIFDFQAPPAGYALLNAHVQLFKGNFSLSIEGRNLLNTSYRNYLNTMRYFADELGINVVFSLTYTF